MASVQGECTECWDLWNARGMSCELNGNSEYDDCFVSAEPVYIPSYPTFLGVHRSVQGCLVILIVTNISRNIL